jgi:hypothetical protein
MVRGGRAEEPAPRSDVSFRLDPKTANFKAVIASRLMQWSVLTEEKQKNQLAQTERVSLHKNNNSDKGGQLLADLRLYISFALQQKTANFKVALPSRDLQCSAVSEKNQKN